jgi:hypothetical protein
VTGKQKYILIMTCVVSFTWGVIVMGVLIHPDKFWVCPFALLMTITFGVAVKEEWHE